MRIVFTVIVAVLTAIGLQAVGAADLGVLPGKAINALWPSKPQTVAAESPAAPHKPVLTDYAPRRIKEMEEKGERIDEEMWTLTKKFKTLVTEKDLNEQEKQAWVAKAMEQLKLNQKIADAVRHCPPATAEKPAEPVKTPAKASESRELTHLGWIYTPGPCGWRREPVWADVFGVLYRSDARTTVDDASRVSWVSPSSFNEWISRISRIK